MLESRLAGRDKERLGLKCNKGQSPQGGTPPHPGNSAISEGKMPSGVVSGPKKQQQI